MLSFFATIALAVLFGFVLGVPAGGNDMLRRLRAFDPKVYRAFVRTQAGFPPEE